MQGLRELLEVLLKFLVLALVFLHRLLILLPLEAVEALNRIGTVDCLKVVLLNFCGVNRGLRDCGGVGRSRPRLRMTLLAVG